MTEESLQCPLITTYTTHKGIDETTLERLFLVRKWDIQRDDAGVIHNPIPFKWPSLLRKTIWDIDNDCDSGVPLELRQYQIQQIHHHIRMDKFINGDGVGLGKSLDVIAAAAWLKERNPAAKVVVVTTKSMSYQWRDEFIRFSTLRPFVMKDKYQGLTSSPARQAQMKRFLEGNRKDVIIVKYDSIKGTRKKTDAKFDADGRPVKGGKEAEADDVKYFTKIFKEHKDNLILVFDECHRFKGTATAVRNLVFSIARSAGKVWGLTATVMKNNLNEFYAVAVALGICPFGFMPEFVEEFCIMRPQYIGNGRKKMILVGYQNISKFKAGIRPFFLGRSQRQVKEPLPRLSTVYHPLDLTDQQIDLLDDIKNGVFILPPALVKDADGDLHEMERDVDNLMTQLSVQQLVANHPALLDPSDLKEFYTTKLSPKEEALLDMLDGDLDGEKVICFAQPLDAKILTPAGWKQMGQVVVGDEVIDPDGGVAVVEGVFPQGSKKVYRVETKTGAATECCDDHLWTVQTYSDLRKKSDKWRVCSTSKLREKECLRVNGNGSRHYRYFLPIPQASEFTEPPVGIPAYTLGVLLGDGDITHSVTFAVADFEIVKRVEQECLPHTAVGFIGGINYSITTSIPSEKSPRGHNLPNNNPYTAVLRSLGLMGRSFADKYIPEVCLQSSIEYRTDLLRGLMDTDGTCNKGNGEAHFCSSSPQLAQGVAELARSLGGLATIYGPYPSPFIYKGELKQGHPHWQVYLRTPINPFYLKRKSGVWVEADVKNPIKSITYVGEKECQCIRVSSKRSLYITDDYIVTHNTKYRMWIDRLEKLTKNGDFTNRKFLRITGAENEKKRNDNKRLFQGSADHDLIVINAAGIEGINLQQAAHLVCLDLPWSWGDLIQLVGRMVRMASPHSACTLHILVAKGTIDEYTIDTLKGKKGVFEKILGETHSAGILDNGDFLDLDSGMESGNTDEEYKALLKAHVKKIGVKKFLDGDQIELAHGNANYEMIFQKGKKAGTKKKKTLVVDSKWGEVDEVL